MFLPQVVWKRVNVKGFLYGVIKIEMRVQHYSKCIYIVQGLNIVLHSHIIMEGVLNPLPDDKILDWSKLKQIADILKRIENEQEDHDGPILLT